MNIKTIIISLFIFMLGCSVLNNEQFNNPCDSLENGIYVYPKLTQPISLQESIMMYKIPEDILACISTEGLVQSCLNYPEFRMLWAHNSEQQGFDVVEKMCNGFDELWNRPDKCQSLLELYDQLKIERDWDLYTDLENGEYIFNIMHHEIIIAQDNVLDDLSNIQKSNLFMLVYDNSLKKRELIREIYGITGMESSLSILSRIMYEDQYEPFIVEFNSNEVLRYHVSNIKILDARIVDLVFKISEQYLIFKKERK